MSGPNLAPLRLVVSHNTGTEWSQSTIQAPQTSSGSDFHHQDANIELQPRRQPLRSMSGTIHMEDDPHDFYLGDIYARIDRPFDCYLRTEAERQETPGPYHEHVRRLCRGWHHQRYLADFMTVSTVPLRARNLGLKDRKERLNRVDITILEYGTELNSKELKSPAQLENYLSGFKSHDNRTEGRLIIVQDLSTYMIERLGATFDIEPGFFRSHIGDYVWLNTRDPQAEIPELEAFSQKSNYFSIQYVQPRYFASQESLELAKNQTESFNILRRIDHDGRFKPWSDMPNSDVGLVRGKVSLWVRPKSTENRDWLGIMLVDPTIAHGFPLWSGYGSFHQPPSIHKADSEIPFPPYDKNMVKQFMFWTLNQANANPNTIPSSPDLLPISYFTMICAQWILMCEYINTRLGQIEWEIELGLSHLYSQDFDHTVKTLLAWRRRLPIYHTLVERSITRLSIRHQPPQDDDTHTGPFDSWSSILINLKDIQHRLSLLHRRAEKIMAVSMAVTAREESKKATQESHAITRVSYLAFIFVPLSFWTSFFSMSGEFPWRTYWVYAAVALPISACALMALVFAGRIGRWVRGVAEEWGWKERRVKEKWNGGD
ncbi:hypothetical protein B0O99DRAFT_693221 [Bisporella sp. PMI_857]|nr:hypothetical protein B0O99DRAFT_693221 [Bisporella sp. PMI_857]